jgi:hypothetical protein
MATGTEQGATLLEVVGSSPPHEAHVQFPPSSLLQWRPTRSWKVASRKEKPRDGALDGTLNLRVVAKTFTEKVQPSPRGDPRMVPSHRGPPSNRRCQRPNDGN